jgi:hypothetical protein
MPKRPSSPSRYTHTFLRRYLPSGVSMKPCSRREARLQEALTAGAVTAFEWNPRNGLSQRSKNATQILGVGPQQSFTAAQFLARVHPDDRARFKALVDGVRVDSPSYSVTVTDAQGRWAVYVPLRVGEDCGAANGSLTWRRQLIPR